jgi:hypothetical protein
MLPQITKSDLVCGTAIAEEKAREIERLLTGMAYEDARDALELVELSLDYQAQQVIVRPLISAEEGIIPES